MYAFDMAMSPDRWIIPTRQSLLSRLKDWSDHDSWKAFFDTYWKLIYQTAMKSGLRDVEAQEVVQETVICVSKAMPGFKYDPAIGSFKAWLLQLTRWRITDQFRKRLPAPGLRAESPLEEFNIDVTQDLASVQAPGLEAVWKEEWDKNLIDAAIERVKRQVPAQQYQMFDFYVLQEWPVKKVAKTLGVSVGRIYIVKHRLKRLVRKEIERLEKGML